ncbi:MULTISPECIES: glycosyltransferase family 4 protein [Aphanizomenonaceae]|uniref:glycosyltransferase family 4 protein n=1 Tax=Aphanizomenonaceae TaxID=1892259 RepID=UPI0004833CB4|nr:MULTISPECIES: glycosyltransferase family 4 protein [Aphanizomenonaceae]MBE9257152.1 glycosyltransferase family 4 protein [Dolichospermum sp. LEGE 00246]MDK2412187.1 glycosyltransferase family 4 protein [Aphanizomenon sp. 202]MDK2461944.1 glycosyltransferase family 4 protein [Aphanizomenon sp. PH219]
MKIVFVNPVGVIGGAERVLLTIIAALLNTKPNIQLFLIVGTDGPLIEEAEKLGVQVKLVKLPEELNQLGDSAFKGSNRAVMGLILLFRLVKILPNIGQYLREFQRSLQQLQPDLIHSNGIKTHLLIALAGIKDIPIIWHIHDFYSSRPFMARVLKQVSYGAKLGIAISEAVAKDAKTTLPKLPIELIYNAVDINYFSPIPSPRHTFLKIGLVATFARWKGHDIFLAAAAEIIKTYPNLNVRFCIVGGAIYKTRGSQFSEQELKDKAAHLEIADKVDFLGFQQDIAQVYRDLDIVIHASTQPEPFGLAIVEAMACGKPVIVSQAGGAAELFTHNYDAVGVPPGEPKALAAAIIDLLENPEKRQFLSANARKTATNNFSHQRYGEQIITIYQQVKWSDKIKFTR